MEPRRLAWIILALGLVFLASPAYWNSLQEVGTVWLLDWFSASGMGAGPSNYLAIGGMYVFAAVISLWVAGGEHRRFRQVALGVGVSLLLVGTGLVYYHWAMGSGGFGIWQAVYALGTAPVMVVFHIGFSSEPAITHWLWGIVGLFLLPIVALLIVSFFIQPAPFSLRDVILLVSTMHIFVLDLLWGYPLYRLGRTLQ